MADTYDYPTAVATARQEAERAWAAERALRERDRNLALAWALRPGGHTWEALVDEVNRGLPDKARFKVSTARRAEYAYRDAVERMLREAGQWQEEPAT